MAGFAEGQATPFVNDDLIASTQNLESITIIVDSASQDTGNPESANVLRRGLCMGKLTATGKYKEFNSGGGDGSENEEDVVLLAHEVRERQGETDPLASDKSAQAYYAGTFFSAKIYGDAGLVWADVQRIRRR